MDGWTEKPRRRTALATGSLLRIFDVFEEAIDHGRRFRGFGRERLCRDGRLVVFLRVRVGQLVGEARRPEAGDKAMLFTREERDFRVLPAGEGVVQEVAQPLAFARRDAAGAAVGDQAVFERGEIAPGDEVALVHFDVRAERFEDARGRAGSGAGRSRKGRGGPARFRA